MSEQQREVRGAFLGPLLAAGSIYGFRRWKVVFINDEPHLTGINGIHWEAEGGEFTAICTKIQATCNCAQCVANRVMHDEGFPRKDCSCGFYAYTTEADVENLRRRSAYFTGIIEGYGRCVVGTRGFRCGKARIKALVVPRLVSHQPPARAREVGEHYEVPIFTDADEAIREFPLGVHT